MNIIVLTNCSWDDTGSVGNTLSNWFGGWKDANFSNLYSREEMPNNHCCDSYFKVSPTNILRHFFSPWNIGYEFKNCAYQEKKQSAESNLIDTTRGKKSRELLLIIAEIVYSSKIWLNKKIKSYITKQNPDIAFCFAISDPFRYHLCKYLKSLSVPIAMYIADDVYGAYIKKKGFVTKRYKKRFESMIKMADKVYGASEMMCEKYSSLFGVKATPLYKGCILSKPKTHHNTPIRLAYAGNLFYGRSDTLGAVAKALQEINEINGPVAQLEIYTGSPITKELDQTLNIAGSSRIMGQKPYSEIVEILKTVDIVLHVESFEQEQIDIVKYSFSTKIIDCLQSGSVMMVVGPKGIASVEYPRSISGTIVVDDTKELLSILTFICDNPNCLLERAKSIHAVASRDFPIEKVRNKLRAEFGSILSTV